MATFTASKEARVALAYEVRKRQRYHMTCLAVFGGVGLYALLSIIGNIAIASEDKGLDTASYVFATTLAIWMYLLAFLRLRRTDADILKGREDEQISIDKDRLVYQYRQTQKTYSATWPIQYIRYEIDLADIRDVKRNEQLGRVEFSFDGMLYRHRGDGVDEPEHIANGILYFYEYFNDMTVLQACLKAAEKDTCTSGENDHE